MSFPPNFDLYDKRYFDYDEPHCAASLQIKIIAKDGLFHGGKFNLDVSGIAGFFGGDESIAAMASVNLIRYRWLLGWYNCPGSYFVSKKYGIIAGTRFWDGVFPGKESIPATILGMDGQRGPSFYGAKSGTAFIMTGHLAHLLFFHCTDPGSSGPPAIFIPPDRSYSPNDDDQDMPQSPTPKPNDNEYFYSLTLVSMPNSSKDSNSKEKMPLVTHDNDMEKFITPMSITGFLAALLTIGFSITAAVISAVVWHDYFCCIAISIGIFCNGFATLVYGSGSLTIETPFIVPHPVPGDGVFVQDNDIVILQGPESKVASITRGKYKLTYRNGPSYHTIGFVSMALVIQAFSQLILLPSATLKGQIIFLATFALSWFYNAYLASVEREKLQFMALKKMLGLGETGSGCLEKKSFKRWASIVAASTFQLRPIRPDSWLRQLIPNDTPVWDKWREYIIQAIELDSDGVTPTFELPTDGVDGWNEVDKSRLRNNLESAKIGYEWYRSQRNVDDSLDRKYQ
ncbi:hypothetical protein BJ912DRAFT_1067638 [Pholiota molesta]|nr:hypothetical protein BJ912DRAFT_1067638 [Pholiota molesta]